MREHVRRRCDVSGETVSDDRRGVTAPGDRAACERPASGARARRYATVVMLACVASAVTFAAYGWRLRGATRPLSSAPFRIDESAWRAVLTVATTSDRFCPASVPVVIVYINSSCRHCKAELERWADLVRAHALQLRCVGLAIVSAPGSTRSAAEWLPRELIPALLWDHDGTVGRALEARLVPLAAYVSNSGIVIARVPGEASEMQTSQHLAALRRTTLSSVDAPDNE